MHQQVAGSQNAPLMRAKGFASGSADQSPAFMQDSSDRIPGELANAIASIYHALVTFINRINVQALIQRGAYHTAHRGIHPLGVSTAGKHPQAFANG